MFNTFAMSGLDSLHVNLAVEEIFRLGPISVTNSLLLGTMGILVMLVLLFYAATKLKRGKHNFFTGLVQWTFEGFLAQAEDIIGNKTTARHIFPLAITMFFTIITTYWLSVVPGVGTITVDGVPLFRALPADLNFTFALAIITIVASQVYAVRQHGFFGNVGRFFKNPIKNPIGAFEGLLELIGEFSRMVALSLRLFGNAFAGEVLLMVIALLSGYLTVVTLPFFMAFELFIGFIQAYVFFVLTLIFTALATQSHGDDHSSDHSPAAPTSKAAQLE